MAAKTIQPLSNSGPSLPDDDGQHSYDADSAANLIRQKLEQIYEDEPDAAEELQEAEAVAPRSKHQQFMHELSKSGKDLAAIQTEWHTYYQSLPPVEQHQVWQEFYASQSVVTGQLQAPPKPQAVAEHKQAAAAPKRTTASNARKSKLRDARSAVEVQAAIRDSVTAGGKLTAKHHLQSLLFGLGMGSIVLVIFLFSFFNEVIVAPFIQPSRVTAATPLIVGTDSVAATDQSEVIIPKINVQIPTDYSQTSTNESTIEDALENGVVHYPSTVVPGQAGNAAFFGHSSNNIFNKGKYKFAFVLLHTIVPSDTFYLTYNKQVYVYKVISRTVVDPSEVGVLGPVQGQTATATLITCDPPGTSLKRLVVVGQQISPDPAGNTQAAAPTGLNAAASTLPGNGPTLWGRLVGTTIGKFAVIALVVAVCIFVLRKVNGSLLPKPQNQNRRA